MDMLNELLVKEQKLCETLEPIAEQYHCLTTELHMVRAGIAMLTPKQNSTRKGLATSWTQEKLAEVEALKASGLTWDGVAKTLGIESGTLYKAVVRARQAANR